MGYNASRHHIPQAAEPGVCFPLMKSPPQIPHAYFCPFPPYQHFSTRLHSELISTSILASPWGWVVCAITRDGGVPVPGMKEVNMVLKDVV